MADHMSPNSSPQNPGRFGGRRVNNNPLLIIFVIALAFIGMIVLVGIKRSQQNNHAEEEKLTKNSSSLAMEIAGGDRGGMIGAPIKEEDQMLNSNNDNESDLVQPQPLEMGNAPKVVDQLAKEKARIREIKIKQFEKAIKAPAEITNSGKFQNESKSTNKVTGTRRERLLAKVAAARRKANIESGTDVTKSFKTHLAAMKASGFAVTTQAANLDNPDSYQDRLFSPNDDWKLKSEINIPETPFTLRAGFVIPGIMITGINSELPGRISAQISQNVRDTAKTSHILLPQGTRLDGTYLSDVRYGQSRLLVAWNRLIFPDGKALDIGKMPGADSAGYSGFSDQVDNHYMRIFGSAILMSGITAGISYATGSDSDDERPFSDTLAESLATNLGEVTVKMIEKNMNIAPTLKVRPGYRFNILVTKDMVFEKPYQSFDYQR